MWNSITNLPLEVFEMIVSVGVDVAKDKHDCFIVGLEGEVLADVFTISNNIDGFHTRFGPVSYLRIK